MGLAVVEEASGAVKSFHCVANSLSFYGLVLLDSYRDIILDLISSLIREIVLVPRKIVKNCLWILEPVKNLRAKAKQTLVKVNFLSEAHKRVVLLAHHLPKGFQVAYVIFDIGFEPILGNLVSMVGNVLGI